MMMKFWNADIWSNLSAHSPAISPSAPSMPAPSKANTRIHKGWANDGGANHTVTRNTPAPTTNPRTTLAPT